MIQCGSEGQRQFVGDNGGVLAVPASCVLTHHPQTLSHSLTHSPSHSLPLFELTRTPTLSPSLPPTPPTQPNPTHQLLGDTLFDIRKQAGGRVDLPTVKAVGLSTLAAIEGLHSLGFIHRDIKPANFVINPPNAAASRGESESESVSMCVWSE